MAQVDTRPINGFSLLWIHINNNIAEKTSYFLKVTAGGRSRRQRYFDTLPHSGDGLSVGYCLCGAIHAFPIAGELHAQ